MIIEEGSVTNYDSRFDEYENIRSRIKNSFVYINEEDGCWHTITDVASPICSADMIVIRYKNSKKLARQIIQLPYPFILTKGVLYLWGLIAGSTIQKRNLGISLDASQEDLVHRLVRELGFAVKITPVRRSRQRYGAEQISLSHYRKIKVTFPSVFLKFLTCLGYRPGEPCMPKWFTFEQRTSWVEGYLNSSKLQCQIQHHDSITPKLIIYASESFSEEVVEVLDHLDIGFYIYQGENRTQIIIQKRISLERFIQIFNIRRPKIGALTALLQRFGTDPAMRLSLRKFKLTEFQLTLYGAALMADARTGEELEYTTFEKIFACSSNTIRQNLYYFDKIGLISYYEKENHKEFITLSTRYLANIEEFMKKEEEQLKAQLKYTESNALSFHCTNCDQVISYTEAIGDHAFECPYCQSKALQVIPVARYFYYGHLGILIQHKKALAEALG